MLYLLEKLHEEIYSAQGIYEHGSRQPQLHVPWRCPGEHCLEEPWHVFVHILILQKVELSRKYYLEKDDQATPGIILATKSNRIVKNLEEDDFSLSGRDTDV